MPPAYSNYLISAIIGEAPGIRTFRLKPADGSMPPAFKPGQFFMLRMPNAPETLKPPFRSYSCLCPPGQPYVEFGIKKHGAFTSMLFEKKAGDIMEVAGPYGVFTLPEGDCPAVFLAGGIGITPLLCQIQSKIEAGGNSPFFLFYSNRHEEEFAYKGLIDSLADLDGNFSPVYTLTCEEPPESWHGECGRISQQMLKRHLTPKKIQLADCHYSLCGSPPFVAGLIEMLKGAGVMPEKIHKEQW